MRLVRLGSCRGASGRSEFAAGVGSAWAPILAGAEGKGFSCARAGSSRNNPNKQAASKLGAYRVRASKIWIRPRNIQTVCTSFALRGVFMKNLVNGFAAFQLVSARGPERHGNDNGALRWPE